MKDRPMKNKNLIIIAVVVVIIGVVGFFALSRSSKKVTPVTTTGDEDQVSALPAADPSIVVDLKARADRKEVTLTVAKIPSGTSSIEYELSYTTSEGLPKGAIGKIDVSGKSDIERNILLGTCSKNVCTYDNGVSSVNLVLKFNSADGATQFSKDYPL